jgi:hypothetical protein
MHFNGKEVLKRTFLLVHKLREDGEDKVQAKTNQIEHILFHFGLINILVLEELKKTNTRMGISFLSSIGFGQEVHGTPKTKKTTPVSSENSVQASSSRPQKTKKIDKGQILATIETPEVSTETISRKGSKEKEKGKIPL